MEQLLVSPCRNGETYEGGLVSDATYRFFANGYLMSTSMYVDLLERWVPIAISWLGGISTKHYKAHFVALLNSVKKARLEPSACDALISQVVDFSQGQKNGFIEAYIHVFGYDQ